MTFPQSQLADGDDGFVRLVFRCNAAEWAEAKAVLRQYQLGGGSKLLSWVMFVLLCAAGIAIIWWRTKQLVPAPFQFYLPAATAVLVVCFLVYDRWKKVLGPLTCVELSARGVRVFNDDSETMIPWSGISRRVESAQLFLLWNRRKSLVCIIPKRALPPEVYDVEWLRQIEVGPRNGAAEIALAAEALSAASPGAKASDLRVTYRLGFWNWFDRSMASYRGARGMGLYWLVMVICVGIFVCLEAPNPNAKRQAWEVFCYYLLPLAVIGAVFMALASSAASWLGAGQFREEQSVTLGDEGLTVSSRDKVTIQTWDTYARYKETRFSFLMWSVSSRNWLLLPKSAFDSLQSVEKCRDLLAAHLTRSTWFFA